jgi:hypothetical protein
MAHRNHQINGKTIFVTRSKFSATPPLIGLSSNKKETAGSDVSLNGEIATKKASFSIPVSMKPRVLKRKAFDIAELPSSSASSAS